jgi:DNA primase
MNIRTRFDLFLDKIRPHIIPYLESKGYNTKSAIRCINPEHDDRSPSMLCAHAEENDWRVYCLSCDFRADIFDAYAILEDKPRKGPRWLTETVLPLAMMFNIPPPVIELSADEQFSHDLYRTFEDVASLIEHNTKRFESFPLTYVTDKNWKEETLTVLDIGVLSYETLQSKISEEDRRRFGLNRPDVFNKNHLIFTVRDQFSRPVRFFARRPDNNPKFVSTTSSNLVVDIWRGKGHLYMANLCTRNSSTAIVVEGHPDAVTLYQEGVQNVIGLCGCKVFSEAHADALTLSGMSKCILIYDGDQRGQEAAEALLRKEFVRSGGLNFEVVVLPEEHDPDSYLREEGKDKFNYLIDEKLSAFEFLLSKEDPIQTPEEVCERLIPYIASARSDVKREMMARDLVSFTGDRVSIGAILADVEKVDSLIISAMLEKQKAIVGAAVRQVQNHTPQAREIFRDTLDKLDLLEKEQGGKGSKAACLARIQACKMIEETRSTGGYKLEEGSLNSVSDILEGGDWTGSKVFIVGGVKNVGKSTFVDNFIWQAVTNLDNNVIAFLLTIDDPIEARLRRMGCCAVNDKDFTQNMMANPNFYAEELGIAEVYEKREYAYSKLTEVVAGGKLIIEDVRDGSTLSYAESRLSQIRRENPESNIIFGLDNFHDTNDWVGGETKDRVGRQIKYGKRICEIYKALGVFTAEYRKLSDPSKPGTDDDLADSRALLYAPHLTMHLFSDLDTKGEEKALLVHRHNGMIMPRVRLNIGKNKVTSIKGSNRLAFDFYPGAALFKNVPLEQAKRDEKERRKELEERKARQEVMTAEESAQ